MDGDSKPHFRRYCYDFPQDTQLFDWHLSHHHWHIGDYRVLQPVDPFGGDHPIRLMNNLGRSQ